MNKLTFFAAFESDDPESLDPLADDWISYVVKQRGEDDKKILAKCPNKHAAELIVAALQSTLPEDTPEYKVIA